AVLVLIGLYAAFELGRYYAGYNIVSALQERAGLQGSIRQLKDSNRALQARIIRLETMTAGHTREDQVVARTIGDLQAQVARQTEELAFYRAVVAEGAPPIGVRVGTVRLSVDGQGPEGKPATLDSQALAGGGATNVTYDLRYYQDLEQTVTLPLGFRPEHLTVTVTSNRKDIAPLTQAFPWSAVVVP